MSSEPYFEHSDTKLDYKNVVDQNLGGGGGLITPLLDSPLGLLFKIEVIKVAFELSQIDKHDIEFKLCQLQLLVE